MAAGAAIGTATRIDGATKETIGRISRTAKADASTTCRTAARLLRATRTPASASAVVMVTLARIDAATEPLIASIAALRLICRSARAARCDR